SRILKYAGLQLALVALYVSSAKLGLLLAFVQGNVSPVWPPTGIFLATIFLLGARNWPAITTGAFITVYLTGAPLSACVLITIGHTLEPLIIVRLMRRFGISPSLDRVRDVTAFLFVVAAGTTVATAIGIASVWIAGRLPTAIVPTATLVWWVGNYISALVLAPPILTWGSLWLGS